MRQLTKEYRWLLRHKSAVERQQKQNGLTRENCIELTKWETKLDNWERAHPNY